MLSFAPGRPLVEGEFRTKLAEFLGEANIRGNRVLVIVPDDTRTVPMPAIYETLVEVLLPKVKELAFLVALGTHPPLTEAELSRHFGRRFPHPKVPTHQHSWQDSQTLVRVGTISKDRMAEISRGLLPLEVAVEISRLKSSRASLRFEEETPLL